MIEVLREEVQKYAAGGRGVNVLLFAILDDERQIYAINAVDYPKREEPADVVVLLQRGVPRDQLMLVNQYRMLINSNWVFR